VKLAIPEPANRARPPSRLKLDAPPAFFWPKPKKKKIFFIVKNGSFWGGGVNGLRPSVRVFGWRGLGWAGLGWVRGGRDGSGVTVWY
jgi:hypothetical protein